MIKTIQIIFFVVLLFFVANEVCAGTLWVAGGAIVTSSGLIEVEDDPGSFPTGMFKYQIFRRHNHGISLGFCYPWGIADYEYSRCNEKICFGFSVGVGVGILLPIFVGPFIEYRFSPQLSLYASLRTSAMLIFHPRPGGINLALFGARWDF